MTTKRKRRATITEFQAMARPSPEERIQHTPAPRRVRRELDDDWNPGEALVCPICRREVEELFPFGYMRTRLACKECIERRKATLEMKGRVLAVKRAPKPGGATRARMRMIRYYAKTVPPI